MKPRWVVSLPRHGLGGASALLVLAGGITGLAQPDPNWLDHDRARPQPPVVTPATPGTQEQRKFFAMTTDVQLEFRTHAAGRVERVLGSVGEGANPAKKIK